MQFKKKNYSDMFFSRNQKYKNKQMTKIVKINTPLYAQIFIRTQI